MTLKENITKIILGIGIVFFVIFILLSIVLLTDSIVEIFNPKSLDIVFGIGIMDRILFTIMEVLIISIVYCIFYFIGKLGYKYILKIEGI